MSAESLLSERAATAETQDDELGGPDELGGRTNSTQELNLGGPGVGFSVSPGVVSKGTHCGRVIVGLLIGVLL